MSDHPTSPAPPNPSEPAGLHQPSWFARHKVLTLLGVVVVLVIAVALAGGGGGTPQSTPTGQPTSAAAGGAKEGAADQAASTDAHPADTPAGAFGAGIGDPVRDGALEFVVISVTPGPARIGTSDFGVKPQGEFLFVTVQVTNIGQEPATLFGDNQYLYAGERKFSADTEAAIYLDDAQTLLEEINPGNSLTGVLVYDVPPGTTPTHIELHDSAFSGGVTVALS